MSIQEHDLSTRRDEAPDKRDSHPLKQEEQSRENIPIQKSSHQPRRSFSSNTILFLSLLLMALLLIVGSLATVQIAAQSNPRFKPINQATGPAVSPAPETPGAHEMSGATMESHMSTPKSSVENIPVAKETYGNQRAKYILDADGFKHFTLTAKQVMWEPVKGKRMKAWTFDGTVPGPLIRVTAGDLVRITIKNQLPEETSVHWHGLLVESEADGVPGIGQKPIKPGENYTYSFQIRDEDAGTHWYHSHHNDLSQVPGGFYGAFLIDPRPGSVQEKLMPKADVESVQIISEFYGYYVLNGKSFPDTEPIKLEKGQTVLLRLIGAGVMSHPMHLHGHFFDVVATDGRPVTQPLRKDTVNVSPGETYDLLFEGWADPGSVYPFHCHILAHLLNPGQKGHEMGGLIALVEYEK